MTQRRDHYRSGLSHSSSRNPSSCRILAYFWHYKSGSVKNNEIASLCVSLKPNAPEGEKRGKSVRDYLDFAFLLNLCFQIRNELDAKFLLQDMIVSFYFRAVDPKLVSSG